MIEELEYKLKILQEKRKKLEEKKYEVEDDYLEKECIYYEIDRLIDEALSIKRKIHLLKAPGVEGKNVDIKELTKNKSTNYYIYLHATDTIIGEISYRGYHVKKTLGDIGYEIYEEYQGNGYAYEALSLLGEKLNQDGIDDFWIATTIDNIPSKKIIEKYGGVLFDKEDNILVYSCKTKKKELKKKTI